MTTQLMTWKAITERALWTAAEAGVGLLSVEALVGGEIPVLAAAGATTVLSFVKNVAIQRLQVIGRLRP